MNEGNEILIKCAQELEQTWKKEYGLGTQYEGYLSPALMKEIMSVRRVEGDYSSLDLKENVKYRIIAVVEKYDLSEGAVDKRCWHDFWEYVSQKIRS